MGILDALQSPLFLGGAGLMSGGGMGAMSQGFQTGIMATQQNRDAAQKAQRDSLWNEYFQNGQADKAFPGLPQGILPLVRAAGPDQGPQIGINALMHTYRNPLDDEMKRAQIGMTNAHAGAYRAMSNFRDAQANLSGNKATLLDPSQGWGLDENGRIVKLGSSAAAPAAGFTAAPPLPEGAEVAPAKREGVGRFSPTSNPYGEVGRTSDTVPGVVVNGKGGSDKYASETLAGQQALGNVDAERRARLERFMAEQQALKAINGGREPPSGNYWTGPGTYASGAVKDTATERAMRMHAQSGMGTIIEAEKLLNNNGTLAQLAGDTYGIPGTNMKVGGFGEAGRGFRAAESAVLQLNFALSGKSVSNAERQHFQRIYMPSATDSAATQKWKIGQVKSFFQSVLDARQKGMDDDQVAAMYRTKIAEGAAGPQENAKQQAPDLSKIPTEELLKRLGR